MVEDMPKFGLDSHLASADAEGLDRRFVLQHPGGLIEDMDLLLDDVIAREPGEVEPVAQLPLHVAPLALARIVPEGAAVVVGVDGDDLADGAVVNSRDGLAR